MQLYQRWAVPDMETVRSSETPMSVYQTSRRLIPECISISVCSAPCPMYTGGQTSSCLDNLLRVNRRKRMQIET